MRCTIEPRAHRDGSRADRRSRACVRAQANAVHLAAELPLWEGAPAPRVLYSASSKAGSDLQARPAHPRPLPPDAPGDPGACCESGRRNPARQPCTLLHWVPCSSVLSMLHVGSV